MKTLSFNIRKGFTLIELLVVIGILAILLAITLIAINPARQFRQANDTKRASDVNAILNAVGQYAADLSHKGALPGGITETGQEISTAGADICSALVPTYIQALPVDPLVNGGAPVTDCAVAGGYQTGYNIVKNAAGRVTVTATRTEETTPAISVTR